MTEPPEGLVLRREQPVQGMRRTIARRMHQSLQAMAQLTLMTSISTSRLDAVRAEVAEKSARPTYTELIIAAVAKTLPQHPALNATLENDTIYEWASINIGMAVALEQGLIVPVIKAAEAPTLGELQDQCRKLGDLGRAGKLHAVDLTGATFTVSNLGALGIDTFTPIVDPPQVAILGVGRVLENRMGLSLTIDHRAVDGAPGAMFLQALASELEREADA